MRSVGRLPLLAGLLVAAGTGFPRATLAQDQESFQAELEKVHGLMGRGRWSSAREDLLELLEAHREQPYVLVKQVELMEDLERCSFHVEHPVVELEDVVSGKLASYRESSGEIQITYTADQLADFDQQQDSKKTAVIYLHPMVFQDSYTIEVEGEAYPDTLHSIYAFGGSPTVICCHGTEASYQVIFGLPTGRQQSYLTPKVRRVADGEPEVLDELNSPPQTFGEKYALKVVLSAGGLTAFYNGKRILRCKKEPGSYGQFGFCNMPKMTELSIRGKIQPAWLQGLRDAATRQALERFRETWKREDVVPEWLHSAPAEGGGKIHVQSMYPGPDRPSQMPVLNKAVDHYNEGQWEEGLRYVESLAEGDVTREARLFLKCLFLHTIGRVDAAYDCIEQVCASDPDHLDSRLRLAELALLVLPREDAMQELESILDDFPDATNAYERMAMVLLDQGRPDQARQIVERALEAGISPASLAQLNRTLVRAEKGPEWGKVFEHASRHYEVYSDIDRQVCSDAANVLEESYRSYSIRLRRIQDLERRKFRVYLFAGEESYKAYALDTLGSTPESTSGLYSSTLKQLLIWNLPDRARMMRTVRHEGFHQYLDRLTTHDPPRWFNEGLAEYYEIADMAGNRWVEGTPHPDHVDFFRSKPELRALEELLYIAPAAFYRKDDVSRNYAQSWAFVHFLRETERERAELFDALLAALCAGTPSREALDQVFGPLDVQELNQAYRRHIAELVEKSARAP